MRYKYIFEDGENTPSSLLLKQCFNGKNIYFANGVSRLWQKFLEIYENIEGVTYIFYIDLVPNNDKTKDMYKKLITQIKSNKYMNVIVIPIICIESIILNMLQDVGCLRHSKVSMELFDYVGGVAYHDNLSSVISDVSLEHLYKRILSDQLLYCQRNTIKRSNRQSGKFYIIDCICCSNKRCNGDINLSILEKAERLFTELPAYSIISPKHLEYLEQLGVVFIKMSLAKILALVQSNYDIISDWVQVPHMKIRNSLLSSSRSVIELYTKGISSTNTLKSDLKEISLF